VAGAAPFDGTRRHLLERRQAGLHGDMGFTYLDPDRSTDPARALRGARALVVGALAYSAPRPDRHGPARPSGRVAAYARDDHYGRLRQALRSVARRLRADGWQARVLVDDNALVDREAAYRAALGWYGKNANLLLPGAGSWFVLGSVATTAPLPPAGEPVADGCGSCRRCMDGCPTGAIVAPGVVDARRCLAWLVQRGGTFPIQHRVALGDRFYGCDDCQEVCPPNRAARRRFDEPAARDDPASVDVFDLLASSDDVVLATYGRWYIADRDPRWLRRNALLVLGNTGDPYDGEVQATIGRYRRSRDPVLREHAEWAATRLADRAAAQPAAGPSPQVVR
jgi:epoxyqueuosine reductase